jgi:tetratricopeptide (TPR) repeat protein
MYLDRSYRPRRRRRNFLERFWPFILIAVVAIVLYEQRPAWISPRTFEPTAVPTRSAVSFLADAEIAYRSGKMDKALDAYQDVVRLEPGNPKAYAAMSAIYLILQNFDVSHEMAKKAVEVGPQDVDALNAMARILDWTDQYDAAAGYALDALEIEPNNGTTLAILGEIYTDIGNWDIAQGYLDRALESEPQNITALRNQAFLYEMRGNYEKAVDYYGRAIDAAPYRFDLYVGMGRQYRIGLQDFEKANEAYAKAVEVYESPVTLSALGEGLYNSQDFPGALRALRRAIELDPDYGPAQVYYGMTLYARRNYEDAATHLEQGIALLGDRSRVDHFYTLGLAYIYKDPTECDKAMIWLDKAQEIAPGFNPILQGMAYCRSLSP